ncbi:unnamed protein product [Brugia timori]|uniref:Uncharacterized protein n=1 Tax=Brugia timori TaxID=42155 RepID=A0A0R3QD65_9BILA|nr:unnamed protein product [Brugia timori]
MEEQRELQRSKFNITVILYETAALVFSLKIHLKLNF